MKNKKTSIRLYGFNLPQGSDVYDEEILLEPFVYMINDVIHFVYNFFIQRTQTFHENVSMYISDNSSNQKYIIANDVSLKGILSPGHTLHIVDNAYEKYRITFVMDHESSYIRYRRTLEDANVLIKHKFTPQYRMVIIDKIHWTGETSVVAEVLRNKKRLVPYAIQSNPRYDHDIDIKSFEQMLEKYVGQLFWNKLFSQITPE